MDDKRVDQAAPSRARGNSARRACTVAAAMIASWGCDSGGSDAALSAAASLDPVTAQLSAMSSTKSGVVALSYTLEADADLPADTQAEVLVEYSTNAGATYRQAARGSGGADTSGRSVARRGTTASTQVFSWDSAADGVGLNAEQSVVLRVTPLRDGRKGRSSTRTVTVDNRSLQDVLVVSEDVNGDGFPDLMTLSTAHDPMRIVSVRLHTGRAAGANSGGGGGGNSTTPGAFVDATSSLAGTTLDSAVSRALAAAARHPRRSGATKGFTPVRVKDPSQGNKERFFVIFGR